MQFTDNSFIFLFFDEAAGYFRIAFVANDVLLIGLFEVLCLGAITGDFKVQEVVAFDELGVYDIVLDRFHLAAAHLDLFDIASASTHTLQ